ncbi:PAS domain-containing protein [Bradyrhizobium sp. SYSU BS000235]|uniref:PAS domain-containing sensor histidine kinase n=1 Tax=Bradyrhizobium sp. SYSU BS000235 TaxID=3411332 RepID=UPI003C756C11
MSDASFQLHGVRDPRLAIHATGSLPAWFWATNGTRVLWANPVAAQVFRAENSAELAARTIGPADQHRRQVTQLAARLSPTGATRLERLRGFGAPLGQLLTCACARLTLADGVTGVLVVAIESAGRSMPLNARLAHLIDSVSKPAMAFTLDGKFAGANEAAKNFTSLLNDLSDEGLDQAREAAIADGQSLLQMDFGRVAVHRVGSGAETALIAAIDAVIVPQTQSRASPPVMIPTAHLVSGGEQQRTSDTTTKVTEQAEAPIEAASAIADEATQPAIVSRPDESPAVICEPPADHVHIDQAPAPDPEGSTATANEQAAAEFHAGAELSAADDTPLFVAHPASEGPGVEHEPASVIATDDPAADVIAVESSETDAPAAEASSREVEDPVVATQTTPPDTSHHALEPPAVDMSHVSATLSQIDIPPVVHPRRHPLRFMWQMDQEGRFSLGSDEFTRLIGAHTAAVFGRPWREIVDVLGLDPEGRVAAAVATHDTWSGIVVHCPADGIGTRLPVELSGLPLYDRERNFVGYRGFGVCRDLEGLARLAAQRRDDVLYSPEPQAVSPPKPDALAPDAPPAADTPFSVVNTTEPPSQTEPDSAVDETPKNVLPFRSPTDPKMPTLTPGESNAFDELARRLSARLEGASEPADVVEPALPQTPEIPVQAEAPPEAAAESSLASFLQPQAPPPRANATQDSQFLDRLPVGVLVYRLDRLMYCNRAFLNATGYDSLHALSEAGGLDALFVEPGAPATGNSTESGTAVVISAAKNSGRPADATLFAISWDGEPAHALMFSSTHVEPSAPIAEPAAALPNDDSTLAEELSTILDTTAEGIVMFDGLGRVVSCNRSAEALFGRDDDQMTSLNLIDLFAPESQRGVLDYLESVKGTSVASLLDHGRDVLGRVRDGGIIPLSITMGRTRSDGARFFVIFRDLSQVKKNEGELVQARRQVERSASAKSDILSKISHEVRTPLNAIIGFADVMIEERFGALGNDRYVEYMKDIRASGQRVMTIIDDLLDLSRIESGKMELSFTNQDLNSLVEQCVGVMQPQANRERIIIRTSLAHALPPVKADARALRQIALNLIGSSIHLANAGGQVIVSTATTDFGDIVLRVRDTGPGLNDSEIAAAMAPFRTPLAMDETTDNSTMSLSLTKALVEANRAKFYIKTAPHSGTLIEVVFSHASAIA